MTKYFKTLVKFEVLSEDAHFEGSLEDLHEATQEGGMSGRFLESEVVELTRDEVEKALVEQGSDADFFPLDEEDGKDDKP